MRGITLHISMGPLSGYLCMLDSVAPDLEFRIILQLTQYEICNPLL